MLVAYDGTAFHGFAENAGVTTVGGTLREMLGRVLRHDVELTCAGRTDAGVHAWGQVVSFDAPDDVDLHAVQRSLNRMGAPAVAVREATPAPPDFDARFSAVWRRYRYTVLNTEVHHPLLAHTSWHVPKPLELRRLELATDPFIGEHDFASFCRRPRPGPDQPEPTLVRRVLDAGWDDLGDGLLRFEIRANAFCHQMVRSIVGLLVDVGLGRRTPGEVLEVIRARDRSRASQPAPPHGLCLWEVGYRN